MKPIVIIVIPVSIIIITIVGISLQNTTQQPTAMLTTNSEYEELIKERFNECEKNFEFLSTYEECLKIIYDFEDGTIKGLERIDSRINSMIDMQNQLDLKTESLKNFIKNELDCSEPYGYYLEKYKDSEYQTWFDSNYPLLSINEINSLLENRIVCSFEIQDKKIVEITDLGYSSESMIKQNWNDCKNGTIQIEMSCSNLLSTQVKLYCEDKFSNPNDKYVNLLKEIPECQNTMYNKIWNNED